MAEAQADDCSKVHQDEKNVSNCDVSKKEEENPTYSGQFPESKQDAGQVIAPITDQEAHGTIPQEGTRLLSVIPGKGKAYKSVASYGSCSPFGPVPKVFPNIHTSPKDDGGESKKLASVNEQCTDAQETKSLDSFVVLDAWNEHNNTKEEKEGEKATPGGISNEALTQKVTDGASGSELKNQEDNGDNTSGHQLRTTRPGPEDLQRIPCVVWGPDGRRVVKEENVDSQFRADPLVTPYVFKVCNGRVFTYFEVPGSPDGSEHSYPIPHNIVEEEPEPSMWQCCCMWFGRKLCCRDYEPL